MKEIAILTNLDILNYGNRLQNYAVQKVYESLHVSAETLLPWETTFLRKTYYNLKLFRFLFLNKRERSFILYNKNIMWGRHYVKKRNEVKINKYYDFFSVGSDQIWNPLWIKNDFFFLPFVPPEKRISYAASFGVSEIPEDKKEMVRENLLKFKAISVREDAGAKIVKDLTGRDAEVLIDPTLMLDKEDWIKVENKPRKVDFSKPYILTYFLGKRTERINDDLSKIATENNLQIFNLMDKSVKELYITGPSEFIYLIHHAKLVMTDSFHACVFSFLFQKPFLLYESEGSCNMMSRMDTLFNKFDLRRKFVDSGLPNEIFESDYSEGFQNLQKERDKAIKFLRSALEL